MATARAAFALRTSALHGAPLASSAGAMLTDAFTEAADRGTAQISELTRALSIHADPANPENRPMLMRRTTRSSGGAMMPPLDREPRIRRTTPAQSPPGFELTSSPFVRAAGGTPPRSFDLQPPQVVTLLSAADYDSIEQPEPNTLYCYNNRTYRTDHQGRPVESTGRLSLGRPGRRDRRDGEIGNHGDANDVGFHMAAVRFGFESGPLNVVPGDHDLNQTCYSHMENDLAKLVGSRNAPFTPVNARFRAHYEPRNTGIRPDRFIVEYSIEGAPAQHLEFANREPPPCNRKDSACSPSSTPRSSASPDALPIGLPRGRTRSGYRSADPFPASI